MKKIINISNKPLLIDHIQLLPKNMIILDNRIISPSINRKLLNLENLGFIVIIDIENSTNEEELSEYSLEESIIEEKPKSKKKNTKKKPQSKGE